MYKAIETLLDAVASYDIKGQRIVFLNALHHSNLSIFSDCDLTLQQYFKPYEADLLGSSFNVKPEIPDDDNAYDVACILLPKNMIEAHYLIARGIKLLRSGGILICAADNKSGGSRIKKIMMQFGIKDLEDSSKNKSRAVWGIAQDIDSDMVATSCENGEEQNILDGRFTSRAGVFGWNKIDKGSEILTGFIPTNLKGKGADFGCGYGYLSDFILSNCNKVKRLTCLDADYRSVELCRKNLGGFEVNKEFAWTDLTNTNHDLRNLDFIVMNPPFHEGRSADTSIGKGFIDSAYQALKRGGRLFIVANNHLPYDYILEDKFFKCQKLYEGKGFKVFEALK